MARDKVGGYLVAESPTCSVDWKVLMYAILGRNPESKQYPEIDSRLNTVHCKTVDISDRCDELLHQRRMRLTVDDAESYAVLLYRLFELYEWVDDDSLVEISESIFSHLTASIGGYDVCDSFNFWLNDYPIIEACHNCGENGDAFEVQDQVYLCLECGWQASYQTPWPFLHEDLECLGRLDRWVIKKLESSDDEEE